MKPAPGPEGSGSVTIATISSITAIDTTPANSRTCIRRRTACGGVTIGGASPLPSDPGVGDHLLNPAGGPRPPRMTELAACILVGSDRPGRDIQGNPPSAGPKTTAQPSPD